MLRWLEQNRPEIEKDVEKERRITDETDKALRGAIEEFKKGFAG